MGATEQRRFTTPFPPLPSGDHGGVATPLYFSAQRIGHLPASFAWFSPPPQTLFANNEVGEHNQGYSAPGNHDGASARVGTASKPCVGRGRRYRESACD